MDLATIDGEVVPPGLSRRARGRRRALRPRPGIRPNEIGSPFADQLPRLLHRRRPPEPPPLRLQDRDLARLDAAGRRRGRRRRRPPPPRRSRAPPPVAGTPGAAAGGRRPRRPPHRPRPRGLRRPRAAAADAAAGPDAAPPRLRARRRPPRRAGRPARAGPVPTAPAASGTSPPRRLGAGGREGRARRSQGGRQHGRRGRQVPRRRRRRPGQPVVRELRDLVARAVRPQDARRHRLGRGPDLGARRRGRHRTTSSSSAPPTPAPATSSPTTGAAQDDFGSDGHIGFLASEVEGGKFTALEGNDSDAVTTVPRHLGGANVRFIRINGDAPAPARADAPAPTPSGAPAGGVQASARRSSSPADVGTTYPGDDAPKEQIAAWMARKAHKRGPARASSRSWPRSSSRTCTNLNYGDADSVGFFQMRTSIWNEGEYAGYADNPELQLKWFLDHAVALKRAAARARRPTSARREQVGRVDRRRRASGRAVPLPLPGAARGGPRAARQARRRHAAGGAAPIRARRRRRRRRADAAAAGAAALAIAKKYLGTPYQWGGETPETASTARA